MDVFISVYPILFLNSNHKKYVGKKNPRTPQRPKSKFSSKKISKTQKKQKFPLVSVQSRKKQKEFPPFFLQKTPKGCLILLECRGKSLKM